MAIVVSVGPVQGGWMVRASPWLAPTVFLSGGKAEAAGRRVGEALAQTGVWTEVQVAAGDGVPAGRIICPPPAANRPH